jgi:DNA-binding transcriptional MerR regulator
LERIRALQHKGFTLSTIVRLVSGDLDAADEALLGELSGLDRAGGIPAPGETGTDTSGDGSSVPDTGSARPGERMFTIDELAEETGVPLALLKAVAAEGLLIPRRIGGHECFTTEDVAAARAGLLLLEWGIPLSALLDLARRHHQATAAVADEAVSLFSTHIRLPLRQGRPVAADGGDHPSGDEGVDRLVQAYSELLPAVNTLVANHFTRTLMATALEHVEQVGSDAERRAISDQMATEGSEPTVEWRTGSSVQLQ